MFVISTRTLLKGKQIFLATEKQFFANFFYKLLNTASEEKDQRIFHLILMQTCETSRGIISSFYLLFWLF